MGDLWGLYEPAVLPIHNREYAVVLSQLKPAHFEATTSSAILSSIETSLLSVLVNADELYLFICVDAKNPFILYNYSSVP